MAWTIYYPLYVRQWIIIGHLSFDFIALYVCKFVCCNQETKSYSTSTNITLHCSSIQLLHSTWLSRPYISSWFVYWAWHFFHFWISAENTMTNPSEVSSVKGVEGRLQPPSDEELAGGSIFIVSRWTSIKQAKRLGQGRDDEHNGFVWVTTISMFLPKPF